MNEEETYRRRMSDTREWKIINSWPLITSGVLTLIALGGFTASFHFFESHQAKQDEIIESIQKTQENNASIVTRLVTLQEVTNSRIFSLEQWRNHSMEYEAKEGKVPPITKRRHW